MNLLEKFWNEKITHKLFVDYDFETLPEQHKKRMKESFSFQCYQLKHHFKDVKKHIIDAIKELFKCR